MNKKQIYKHLGANIKTARKLRGYTQAELADRIGKGLQFVGKIETAFSKPSFDTIIDISYALNINLDELMNFEKHEQKKRYHTGSGI